MKQQILIIENSDAVDFENRVNVCLTEGWKISSTSCGFVNSESYNFCSSYQAILVKEVANELQ
jgi:hypothetical protein